jgi:hypothetical protein
MGQPLPWQCKGGPAPCVVAHFSNARSGAPPVVSLPTQLPMLFLGAKRWPPASYLYGEVGAVRVNYQEWPLEIERRPVEKFNDESRPPRPLIRKNRE